MFSRNTFTIKRRNFIYLTGFKNQQYLLLAHICILYKEDKLQQICFHSLHISLIYYNKSIQKKSKNNMYFIESLKNISVPIGQFTGFSNMYTFLILLYICFI